MIAFFTDYVNELSNDLSITNLLYKLGVFLVMMKNTFVPVKRDNTVNTYSFQLSHQGVSEVSERAREQSKRAKRA